MNNIAKPNQLIQMSPNTWYIENERRWALIYKVNNTYMVETRTSYPIVSEPQLNQFDSLDQAKQYAIEFTQ